MASSQDDASLASFLKRVADKMDEDKAKQETTNDNSEPNKTTNQSKSAVLEFDIDDFEIEVATAADNSATKDVKQAEPGTQVESGAAKDDQGESVENLLALLRNDIKSSDWLKENTADKWIAENPETAAEYMKRAKEGPEEEFTFF